MLLPSISQSEQQDRKFTMLDKAVRRLTVQDLALLLTSVSGQLGISFILERQHLLYPSRLHFDGARLPQPYCHGQGS